MRIVLATFVLLSGCGFEHGGLDNEDGVVPDAPGLPSGPTGPGSGTTTPNRTCAYPDPSNRLCLEFTDGVMSPVHDASAQKLDVAATGITGTTRNSDPAAKISSTGSLSVPESPMFDISGSITLEAWVNLSTWPTSDWNIIDNPNQYRLAIDQFGHPGCEMAGTQVFTSGYIALVNPGTWHHIACTYDTASRTVRIYLDGSAGYCAGGDSSIATSGTTGTTIAQGFKGDFDGVRIYAKDMSPEICKHAGRTQCSPMCQLSDGGGGPGGFGGH